MNIASYKQVICVFLSFASNCGQNNHYKNELRGCARHGLGYSIMKKIWCVYIIIAFLATSVYSCNIKSQDSFSLLLDKARQGDGIAYLKLADCYRTGDGVKRDFFNMITMAQMTELYGCSIDDYINGLPDDDEYKTLFKLMDTYHACSEDSVKSVIQKIKSKGGLEAQTLLGMITIDQGDSIAGMEMIKKAAEQECSIAEILLYGANEKTGQQADTLKLHLIASRVPLAYSLLGDVYYNKIDGGLNRNQLQAVKYYMEAEKHGVLGLHGAARVLDYCQRNKDFKLTTDDVKRLELITQPRRYTKEE